MFLVNRRFSVLTVLMLSLMASQAALTITNTMRICEFGDSLTTPITSPPGMWPHYVESFYVMRYPTLQQHWRAEGRGGGQITNTYGSSSDPFSRYDQRVIGYRANMVSVLLTPNGGQDNVTFSNSLYSLISTRIVGYTSSGYAGGIPVLIGALPKDLSDGSPTLRDRSDIYQKMGAAQSWNNIDLFELISPAWSNNFAAGHPVNLGWVDSVHFGLAGHLTVAYSILNGLGEDGLVSTCWIDATAQTSTQKTNCTITSLTSTATSATFQRLDTKLPMCWDDGAVAGLTMYPQILTSLNRYMLIVSNLTAGSYRLKIDGTTVATNTATELLAGINLAAHTTGPIHDQRIEVLGRIRDKQGMDRTTFASILPAQGISKYVSNCTAEWNAGKRDQVLIDAVADEDALTDAYDVLIKNAAQPVTRTFVIEATSVVLNDPIPRLSVTGNVNFTGNGTL